MGQFRILLNKILENNIFPSTKYIIFYVDNVVVIILSLYIYINSNTLPASHAE